MAARAIHGAADTPNTCQTTTAARKPAAYSTMRLMRSPPGPPQPAAPSQRAPAPTPESESRAPSATRPQLMRLLFAHRRLPRHTEPALRSTDQQRHSQQEHERGTAEHPERSDDQEPAHHMDPAALEIIWNAISMPCAAKSTSCQASSPTMVLAITTPKVVKMIAPGQSRPWRLNAHQAPKMASTVPDTPTVTPVALPGAAWAMRVRYIRFSSSLRSRGPRE